jgi:ParB family chromosome partitioning protein
MSIKALGLGYGLDDLLGKASQVAATNGDGVKRSDELVRLSVKQMQPGRYQPRQSFDDNTLSELAESIRTQGLIQPIVVRSMNAGKYEIIAGERRWRAAQLAGLSDVPVIVRDIDDNTAAVVALIENIQREDLNVMQQALALQRLQDDFKLTHQQIATAVGKSRTAVTNTLRLVHLNEDVKQLVSANQLEMGHARALLALPQSQQTKAADEIIKKQLSVRATESLVRRLLTFDDSRGGESRSSSNQLYQDLEQKLTKKFKLPVTIKLNASGSGQLVMEFTDIAQLEKL